MRRTWLLALLALAIGWIYFISSAGIVSTNDGSHFALTRAIADTHSFAIDPYIRYTARSDLGEIPPPDAYLDLSYNAGHFYSDRGPGTALLAVPFYLAGQTMVRAGISSATGLESSVAILAALAGAVLFLATYGLGREIGGRFSAALGAALLVAFGTLTWKYSTVLYSHTVSTALVTSAAYLLLRWSRSSRPRAEAWLVAVCGLLLGYSVVVEYITLLLFLPFGLYLILQRAGIRDWIWAVAGVIPPLALLGFYNRLNFGSPLTSSYAYHYHFLWARSLATTYTTPFVDGLRFFIAGPNGLFAVSPILLLSLIGLALLARKRWREAILLFGSFVVLLAVASAHRTYSGGGTNDTRYILTVVPLLAAPLALLLESLIATRRSLYRIAGWTVLIVVGAFSVLRSFLSLETMFGHVAAERSWTDALSRISSHFSQPSLLPRLSDSYIYLIIAAILVVVPGVGVITRRRALSKPISVQPLQVGITLACLLAITGGFSWYYKAEANGRFEVRESALLAAGSNLLSNGGFESADSSGSLAGWRTTGAVALAREGRTSRQSVVLGPGPGELSAALVYVSGGQQHGLTWYSRGDGPYTVDFVWENDQRQVITVNSGRFKPGSDWKMNSLAFVAPLEATGLRIRLRAESGKISIDDVRLAQAGVRVEPLANYGKAALAFTFDWETAMGGAIHSRGAGEPTFEGANGHGLLMRQGAENLLKIFQRYDVHGTFYATGYNLLDGNTERRSFSGNPTYRWASAKNGWESDYWKTHPWYSFDPFGTYQTEPAWYFGDLVDKMRSGGQDVQSHTFGHLYVRGTTPQELQTDLDQWNLVAKEKGIPPAKSFAFPWRSSNSVRLPHYQVLADRGVEAVTRLYQYGDPFELAAITTTPSLLVYPDQQLESTPKSEQNALKTIDAVLAERGFTSLWDHPEDIVDTEAVGMWNRVVAYAASKRDQGLVVDSLTSIVDHYLAVRKLKMEFSQNGQELAVAVKNTGETKIEGTTLTLPGLVKKAATRGGQSLDFRRDQVLLPPLEPGTGLEIVATLE